MDTLTAFAFVLRVYAHGDRAVANHIWDDFMVIYPDGVQYSAWGSYISSWIELSDVAEGFTHYESCYYPQSE